MNSYNVIFKGEIAEGKDRHKLSVALAKFLKIPEEKAHLLFSGNPICIKKALSEGEANALKAKLNSVGIITYTKLVPAQTSSTKPVTITSETQPKVATPTKPKPVIAVKPAVKSYDELSKGWQKVFAEFDLREADKLGLLACAKHPAHTSRPKNQQLKANFVVNFNILAFLFGPFYYFAKGMWKKGLYLTLMLIMANICIYMVWELFSGSELIDRLLPSLNCAIFGALANYDYYRYYKLDETIWPWMPKWMQNWWGILVAYFFGLAILLGAAFLSVVAEESGGTSSVKDSYLDGYEQTTVGLAFDNWSPCKKVNWELQQSTNGIRTVTYHCLTDLSVFKKTLHTAALRMTGDEKKGVPQNLDAASLQVAFTLNHDNSYTVSHVLWDFDLGQTHSQRYITIDNALVDIYRNQLSLSVQELLTIQNLLLNSVIGEQRKFENNAGK